MNCFPSLSRFLLALLALLALTGCPTKRFNTEGSSAEILVEISGLPDSTLREGEEAVLQLFRQYGFIEISDPSTASPSTDWRYFAHPARRFSQYSLYYQKGFMGIGLRDEQRNYDRSDELRQEIRNLTATLEAHFPARPVEFQHWLHFDLR